MRYLRIVPVVLGTITELLGAHLKRPSKIVRLCQSGLGTIRA